MLRQAILHIGSPKTGTTMLQSALATSDTYLNQNGVLQPGCALPRKGNGILLGYHLFNSEQFQGDRENWLNCTQSEAFECAKSSWDNIAEQAARGQHSQLIISSEQFMKNIPSNALANAGRLLSQVADETKVVAYLRSPAALFISLLQEGLKSVKPREDIVNPRSVLHRRDKTSAIIAAYLENVSPHVSLRVYNRKQLYQNDIVADFCDQYLPTIDPSALTRQHAEMNTTISSEAMAIAKNIRTGAVEFPTTSPKVLRTLLLANDRLLANPTKPKLFPDVAQSITNWFSPDLMILRDQHGIVFPDVDYNSLVPNDYDDTIGHYQTVEQLCAVDADRKHALLRRVKFKAKLHPTFRRWAARW